MKEFRLLPVSRTHGVLYDNEKPAPARFMTPGEAKFEASFQTIRQAAFSGKRG